MIFIGIDNGLNGGLAAYDPNFTSLETIPMPVIGVRSAKGNKREYNIPEIIEWINQFHKDIALVILEKAQAFPGMGAPSTFSNGRNYGIMEGILATLRLPYMVVHPKTWQKVVFNGMHHDDTKQASIVTALRLFPDHSFKATEKSIKLHDGMTDSTLMAYYGKLIHKL